MQDKKLELCLRTLYNRVFYLKYFTEFKLTKGYRKKYTARDSIMAENVIWMADHLFPDEKIIVSAHNYHISKYNSKELIMGEILNDHFEGSMYSIGIFGGEGSFANNSRKPVELIGQSDTDHIQVVIKDTKKQASFIDLNQENEKILELFSKPVIVDGSFMNLAMEKKIILSDAFNGLILIRHINPPEFPY